MIRWVAVIFLGLILFSVLFPAVARLGIGRMPGDIRFRVRGVIVCLPFGSSVMLSAIAFLLAELLK